jgi:ATP-dependent exoDNAse (exonuclease V) alpha subunit
VLTNPAQVSGTQTQLSCSINEPAFPSPAGIVRARCAAWGWEEQSHAQKREDGEHRTFPAVNTVATPIRDIQVLCPMNRGDVGARSLNIEL